MIAHVTGVNCKKKTFKPRYVSTSVTQLLRELRSGVYWPEQPLYTKE